MDDIKYRTALNKVAFLKRIYRSLLFVFIFNASYLVFNKINKDLWFNEVSVYFLLFSGAYLFFNLLKFPATAFMINRFPNVLFGRQERLFIMHSTVFITMLLLKIVIDLNRTVFTEQVTDAYWDMAFWVGIIFIHFYWVFGKNLNFIKRWEDLMIQKMMKDK